MDFYAIQYQEIVDKRINWHVPEKKQTAGKRKRATKGPAPKKPRTEFHPVTKNALKTITRQKMYQNWREKDSEALMTSSSRYPPDFEVSPTRNSVSPYAPIIHQYSTYEHQYLSQNDSWTAFSSATNYNSDVPNFKQNPAPY
ncbi:hypothetical protein L3Y34_019218 [Caenorhabditis briggsae]|uniref:Uncharacterized protein n=1 Tax=Caenorhabditis briggsae TaxID=6238 RepID=A0AAE9IWF2_CAEBR|nr:hypothetical protein L3Y34_019218 [Caenorhabditis briggsae]